MSQFELESEYITITQLLKVLDYIGSGGESKYFLFENKVLLNGNEIYEKKKKIKKGDVVTINNNNILIK
ncbi:RNA-binding S4 domain-containing protein [Acholeplasma granularum]|uniref:RNA-binding S4 domain-containing protein n=1 Tax=Acholeplasma granularum TaxID=264635 RepID=UPI0004BC406E|nr:RNA-binding S4 domain-containing protein [Acholeplasma granularum]